MVIDTLNLKKQVPHQLEMYAGQPSEQIDDYTSAGILPMLDKPETQRLLELEDPYSYRDVLTLPKLLINGTNDRYWAQDALNLYWDDLKGPKWVLYAPNSGHGLEDRGRVFATLSAFIRKAAEKARWPRMHWAYAARGAETELTITSDVKPVSARLFRASSATKDFRDSRWTSEPMQPTAGGFVGRIANPTSGNMAIFGEATYKIGAQTFTLSTQIRILESAR
jgi:PhoPQ-activated pathogenicity-related protein